MNTKHESVIVIYDPRGIAVGFMKMDEKTRKNLTYTCSEAGLEDMEKFINSNAPKIS
jgi:hypothetical protein